MNIPLGLAGAAVLGAHGIGHVLGWLPAWGLATFEKVSTRSWALDPLLGDRLGAMVAGALYAAPTLGFLVAAGALATGLPWWREVAVASAITSLWRRPSSRQPCPPARSRARRWSTWPSSGSPCGARPRWPAWPSGSGGGRFRRG